MKNNILYFVVSHTFKVWPRCFDTINKSSFPQWTRSRTHTHQILFLHYFDCETVSVLRTMRTLGLYSCRRMTKTYDPLFHTEYIRLCPDGAHKYSFSFFFYASPVIIYGREEESRIVFVDCFRRVLNVTRRFYCIMTVYVFRQLRNGQRVFCNVAQLIVNR